MIDAGKVLEGFILSQNTGKRAYSKNVKSKKICNVEKRYTSTELFAAVSPRCHPSLRRLNFSCQWN